MSCQTAHQLHLHVDLLSELCGQPLQVRSGLFNWVISSPQSIAEFLERRPLRFDATDITERPNGPLALPMLDLLLWHDSHDLGGQGKANAAAKFSYLAERFWALASLERRVFVLSNTQGDLSKIADRFGIDCRIDQRTADRIRAALDLAFPRGRNDLLIVGNSTITDVRGAYLLPHVPSSDWEGDAAQWEQFFISRIGGRRYRMNKHSGQFSRRAPPSPPASFFGSLQDELDQIDDTHVLAHIDIHLKYLADKAGVSVETLLSGRSLNVEPQVLADAITNVSMLINRTKSA